MPLRHAVVRGRRGAIGVLIAATVLVALGWRFGGAVGLAGELAQPGADAWLALLGGHVAHEEVLIPAGAQSIVADVYRPARARGAVVLVHGLSPAGRRHPELARLGGLLARHGLLALVPQFDGLAAFRLGGREVDEVAAAVRSLAGTTDRLGLVGFSFGAGPALLAAASLPDLALVGSFGGYADLRRVIAYITTGTHEIDGTRHARRQEQYNRWKLLALLGPFVRGADDRRLLDAIARRRLTDPAASVRDLEAALGTDGRAVMALVTNEREDGVARLIAALPAAAREALDALSPLPAIPRIRGRLLIAHGVEDDSIPFTDSMRLARAAPAPPTLVLFRTFHHTGPQPAWRALADRAHDAWGLLRLTDALLAP